jgi:hypothetical protein
MNLYDFSILLLIFLIIKYFFINFLSSTCTGVEIVILIILHFLNIQNGCLMYYVNYY